MSGRLSRIYDDCVRSPSEELRWRYLASRESDYRISADTGVNRHTLRRFREGKLISMRNFDRLAQYWKLELRPRRTERKSK